MSRHTKVNLLPITEITEIAIHYKRPVFSGMYYMNGVDKAVRFFRDHCYDVMEIDVKEQFWMVCLTSNLRVLAVAKIAVGSQRGVAVTIKEIVQFAFLTHAGAVCICHNHPSGSLQISVQDKRLTKKVQQALELIDIPLVDHIILTSESYTSFVEEELL